MKHYIQSQYRFSSLAFRKTLTEDVLLEKCRILKFDEQFTEKLLDSCVYREAVEEGTRHQKRTTWWSVVLGIHTMIPKRFHCVQSAHNHNHQQYSKTYSEHILHYILEAVMPPRNRYLGDFIQDCPQHCSCHTEEAKTPEGQDCENCEDYKMSCGA